MMTIKRRIKIVIKHLGLRPQKLTAKDTTDFVFSPLLDNVPFNTDSISGTDVTFYFIIGPTYFQIEKEKTGYIRAVIT